MSATSSSFPDLAGKVVLVTGASRGIGEAVALGFASAGALLVLASRKIEGVSAVAETIKSQGGEALAVACHTGKASDVEALAARAKQTFGGVDVVVHTVSSRAADIVNREAARHLRDGGAIVSLSSAAEALPRLAVELRERDITVNTVSLALDRPCVPERVADVIAYLVSGHGHRFTGQVFRVGEARWRP